MLSNARGIKPLIRTYVVASRCYYTNSKQRNKASLYARISPMGNPNADVTLELEKWVETGNRVRFAELQRIVLDLRKRKRFAQALQISEWMKTRDFTFTPVQHAVQMDLIGKVHGFQSAENYFNSLSEEDKTDKTYGALLHCYVRQCETERALAHVSTMKEKGLTLSSLAFNDLMSLYTSIGKIDKVPEIFNQMKEIGVQPDNLSYRMCINSFGVRSDIEGVEKIMDGMERDAHIVIDWNTYAVVANFLIKADLKDKASSILKRAEGRLDGKDGVGYNHLISLHAQLGNKYDILRLWRLEKDNCKGCLNKDYVNLLLSLVKVDELEEAEKVLKEWESSNNVYDFRVPGVVVFGYIDNGLSKNAEALLRRLMEVGKESTPYAWGRLAMGYLVEGKTENSLECLKVALSLCDDSKRAKLDDDAIRELMSLVGEKGRVEDAEKIVDFLR